MRRTLIILFLLMIVGNYGFSQTIYSYQKSVSDPSFRVDYCEFYEADKDIDRLEIYYQVYNSDLLFIRDGDNFRANYTLSISIFDKNGSPVTSYTRQKEIVLDQYARTLSHSDFRTGQVNFELPDGKYKIDCHLSDDNSKKISKKSLEAELNEYNHRNPQISGIEFVFAADTIIHDSAFMKGDMTIVPNVGRLYGEDTASTLSFYFEVYQGQSDDKDIQIETRLLDRRLNTVYFDSLTAEFNKGVIAQLRQVALRNVNAGDYELEIILKGRRGRPVDNNKATFYVHWSPEAMALNDFKTAIGQLKYIASSEEIKAIESHSSARERLQAWQQFWDKRDPTPGTAENEAKIGYYQRIDFANLRFTVMKRDGWKTDRGMIYIIYGEPDQIEDYPFELNRKAYQIWHYYHSDNKQREFLFIDEWGNNDFVLQFPYDGIRY